MQILFHLGMGKTGTTSIQGALGAQAARMRDSGTTYLGVWFDMLDQSAKGRDGFLRILKASPDEQRAIAGEFVVALQRLGADRYIHSNEAVGANYGGLRPFFEALVSDPRIDVSGLIYIRPMEEWLPSAYAQWGVRHKRYSGRVKGFQELAPTLLEDYEAVFQWQELLGDALSIRPYRRDRDIVEDFASFAGVELEPPAQRLLERGDKAELLLRAIYNDSLESPARPGRFDATLGLDGRAPTSIDEMIERCFDFSALPEVIEAAGDLRERVAAIVGPQDGGPSPVTPADAEAIRRRLLDYLVTAMIGQAGRVTALEGEVARLRRSLRDADGAS